MARICVIDDKEMMRESVAAALIREDHGVETFPDPVEALTRIKSSAFDLIVSDLKMPRIDGLSLIRQLRESGNDTPIIMMTAYATVSTAVEAMRLGAYDYIQKPFEAEALNVLVERTLEHARLRRENEALRTTVNDLSSMRVLIGSSKPMVELRSQLELVAASHATVLVCGESGTGKELVASYIHRHSPRADRPMLCLNCAALAASLLESELFGHERGAFTGADRARKGRFELADGGTLLLDEISEMALPLQAKLLRVLQEGEFERVGSSVTKKADVRVLATTNRNLEESVGKNAFRADLFYRLNVLPVVVPPLRDRLEDVPELIAYFLERAGKEDGRTAVRLAPEGLKMLMEHPWPGNVRELENLCRRAVTMTTSNVISGSLIGPWMNPTSKFASDLGALREGRMLQDMERRLVERTLARFDGHRAKSAKALGMGIRTLGMKLKQWREEDESAQTLMAAGVAVGL